MKSTPAYTLARKPQPIPVPGDKQIDEYIGRLNTGTESVSAARMEAPPGWGEPEQTPQFDELTILLEGKMQVEINGEKLILEAGQNILVHKNHTVRYSNPFDETAVYWAVCVPAFSPKTVNRKEE